MPAISYSLTHIVQLNKYADVFGHKWPVFVVYLPKQLKTFSEWNCLQWIAVNIVTIPSAVMNWNYDINVMNYDYTIIITTLHWNQQVYIFLLIYTRTNTSNISRNDAITEASSKWQNSQILENFSWSIEKHNIWLDWFFIWSHLVFFGTTWIWKYIEYRDLNVMMKLWVKQL